MKDVLKDVLIRWKTSETTIIDPNIDVSVFNNLPFLDENKKQIGTTENARKTKEGVVVDIRSAPIPPSGGSGAKRPRKKSN